MKTTQHTPLPYKLNEARSNDFLIAITTADETENIGLVYRAPDKAKAIANAQFIVTACNAHEELLAACKVARAWLSKEESADLTKLDAAIAKAQVKE